jgi:dTMP kinase
MKTPQLKDFIFTGQLVKHSGNFVTGPECELKDLDVDTILSILDRNKIPLVFLNKAQWKAYPEFFEHPHFKAHYEREHALFENLRNEWIAVREKFLKKGIESMLIKSVGSFPYKSSNLDVLIKQDRREKAESILKELGYIQLHNVEEPYKTLFRKFDNGKTSSVIHLHNKVAWINPFHDEELLWTRFRNSPEDSTVDIPSPEDSILILTAHWFYEDKEIKLSDIIKISFCLQKDVLDWEYMKAVAEKKGWLEGLHFALLVQSFVEKNLYGNSSIPDEQMKKMEATLPKWMVVYLKRVYHREILLPFKLPKTFGKFLHFVKTIKDKTSTQSRKLYEVYKVAHGALFVILFEKFKVNIRYQPPMLISISGVDGSGKSTYAKYLYDTLIFCELRTQYVWSRVGSSSFLKPLAKIGKIIYKFKKGNSCQKHYENYEESGERRKVLFGKPSILRILGLLMLLLEMLWQYSLKVRLLLFLRKVVICDRYIYDTLVDIITRYGLNLDSLEGRLFKKIVTAWSPTPDIAYILNVDFDDACNRKNANGKERDLIKDQINMYKEIASAFILNRIKTDNNRSIADIKNKIVSNSLIKYYNKWPIEKKN